MSVNKEERTQIPKRHLSEKWLGYFHKRLTVLKMKDFPSPMDSEFSFKYMMSKKSDDWYSVIVPCQFREWVACEGYPVGWWILVLEENGLKCQGKTVDIRVNL